MASDDDRDQVGEDPSASSPTQPGLARSTPGSPTPSVDAAAVLAFLQQAPPDVREWLTQHAGDSADAPTPAAAAPAPGPADDDLDADLLDEDDDIVARRRRRTASGTPASPVSTQRGGGGLSSRVGVLLIIVALVGGACFGVWFAGRPAASQASASSAAAPTLSSAQSEADAAVRIAELQRIVQDDDTDIDAHLELGVLLFNQGDIAAGRDQWERVTQLDPEAVGAWYNLGFYYLTTDPADYDKAREAWQKVIELDPDSDLAARVTTHINGLMASPSAAGDARSGAGSSPGSGPTATPSESSGS